MNAASPFYLAQLLEADMAVMEEITISEVNKDDFKKLLGGEPMHVAVKYQNTPDQLDRVAIFASTNNRLAGFLNESDRDAIQSRTKTFEFNAEIKSRGDRSNIGLTMDGPPGIIGPEDWWGLYLRNYKAINGHIWDITG